MKILILIAMMMVGCGTDPEAIKGEAGASGLDGSQGEAGVDGSAGTAGADGNDMSIVSTKAYKVSTYVGEPDINDEGASVINAGDIVVHQFSNGMFMITVSGAMFEVVTDGVNNHVETTNWSFTDVGTVSSENGFYGFSRKMDGFAEMVVFFIYDPETSVISITVDVDDNVMNNVMINFTVQEVP